MTHLRDTFDSTYKELKRFTAVYFLDSDTAFDSTYKELKPVDITALTTLSGNLLTLPIRNWNLSSILLKAIALLTFDSTYKELKLWTAYFCYLN